jgi:hypothetical protein
VEAACPWLGSKLNGTLRSFTSERFDAAAEARDQPSPKEIEIIVSAVITRSAFARGATEDSSLVILVILLKLSLVQIGKPV